MNPGDARFAELYDRHHGKLASYCRRRTAADSVEDAVAETFLIAWRRIERMPQEPADLPWLYSIAYRVIGHQYRSRSRRSRLNTKLAGLGIEAATSSEEIVVMNHESRQVLEALSKLKAADQEVLRLSVWEGLSHKDIGRVLDISEEAAKKRFARARTSLARTYDRLERQTVSPAARKGGT